MKIKGQKQTVAVISVPAETILFGRPYSLRLEGDDGDVYIWKQARPKRHGDFAVFDFQDGRNGVLVKTTSRLKDFM